MLNYEPCDHQAERTFFGSIILHFEGGNEIFFFFVIGALL